MISLSWSPGAWRKEGSGERAAPGLCSSQSSPFTHLRKGGGLSSPARLGTVPAARTSSHRPRPIHPHPSPPQRRRGDLGRPRRPAYPRPRRSAVGSPRGRREGNPGRGAEAGEERRRRWGRGVGTWWCLGEGDWGWSPAQAEGGKPEGEGGAGPQRPLPAAAPRPGLLFGSPFGRDPRSASDSGSRPPPPPCPGLEPPQTREAGDGAGAAAASRPSFPRHPSPPRWTSGPWAPHRLGSGNPPRPARLPGLAPPALQSPQPSPRPDFRLPLDAPSLFPPSPAPPAWSGVGGRGGVRPAPSPPRPP